MKLKLKLKPNDVIKYLIEALIVAFGVILGLVLTQYFAQNKIDNNTQTALEHIIKELETNQTEFEKSLVYHNNLGIQIDSLFETVSPEDFEKKYYQFKKFQHTQLKGWVGIGTANSEDVIYESLKINGVFQELNIETIQTITRVYAELEAYEDFKNSFWNKFLSIDSKTTVMDILQILGMIKNDMIYFESQTLEVLKVAKSELEHSTSNKLYKK